MRGNRRGRLKEMREKRMRLEKEGEETYLTDADMRRSYNETIWLLEARVPG